MRLPSWRVIVSRDAPMHSPISSCVSTHHNWVPPLVWRASLHHSSRRPTSLDFTEDVSPDIRSLSNALVQCRLSSLRRFQRLGVAAANERESDWTGVRYGVRSISDFVRFSAGACSQTYRRNYCKNYPYSHDAIWCDPVQKWPNHISSQVHSTGLCHLSANEFCLFLLPKLHFHFSLLAPEDPVYDLVCLPSSDIH